MVKIKYFSLGEFLNSATAQRLNISNVPTFDVVDNLNRLASYLDGIRTKLGKPILISSGYRAPVLNKAVGGVPNSQHITGLAADLVCTDMIALKKVIIETGGYDQLIREHRKGSTSYWLHLSIAAKGKKPRQQVINDLTKE
jgi:hypothetical protein